MLPSEYHKRIVEYYHSTEDAYRDSWDLDNSLAIHYGYWDENCSSFPESLLMMNKVMLETAGITPNDKVLDAGCGVGGSCIYIASEKGCHTTGITLSEKQVSQATRNAVEKNVSGLTDFKLMDFSNTDFPSESFDVVWGCESICYADDKKQFIQEAFRLLKPGGRLIVADGFVAEFKNNEQPLIRKWLDGWQVNYLETPARFAGYMDEAGFIDIHYRDISAHTARSSRRLFRFYYLASIYLAWKKFSLSVNSTAVQRKNIMACKYQYHAMKKRLWQYGIITGRKP